VGDIGIHNFKFCFIGGNSGLSLLNGGVTNSKESLIGRNLVYVVLIGIKSACDKIIKKVLEEVSNFLSGRFVGEVLGD
jgi:hypothetical protein